VYQRLVTAGVDAALAGHLLAALPAPPAEPGAAAEGPERAVAAALAGMLATRDPGAPPSGRVALVGPAGGGKTTAVAKLLARAHLAGAPVAALSLDGTGLASDALPAVAEILDVPYARALTPDAVRAEASRWPAGALALIDTPGLGVGDAGGLAALAQLLAAAGAGEVHLVLPATCKSRDALRAVRAFRPLGPTHLLFTRLDETATPGSLLTVSIEAGLPLSFFGTGREIPGDLVPATAGQLIHRTLTEGDRPA
jgi:flagellar biosynthesis protein FlhF